ncbi:MAG: autoinducer binding domain-containing protein [Paracoccaceae bacterium]|jgi:LuxR family transcriptional regulator
MSLSDQREFFAGLAPAGFYVALRVGYAFPEEDLNEMPQCWIDTYTEQGLVVLDPVMRWVYAHVGATRWSGITEADPAGVIPLAHNLGLKYAATASFTRSVDAGLRSYATLFRTDRDFTDDELEALCGMLRHLHCAKDEEPKLTAAEIEAIRLQAGGLRIKQIAGELGISDSAVKARLSGAKRKLGARTPSELLRIATQKRLI